MPGLRGSESGLCSGVERLFSMRFLPLDVGGVVGTWGPPSLGEDPGVLLFSEVMVIGGLGPLKALAYFQCLG